MSLPILGRRPASSPPSERRIRSDIVDGLLVTVEHDPGGLNADEAEKNKAADVSLARRVGETLNSFYKGHPWAVLVDSYQGICLISIPVLMGESQHYKIPLSLLDDKRVIEAGGHILERFRLPRSSIDFALFHKAVDLRRFNYRKDMPA